MHIIVNGNATELPGSTASYDEIVTLAGHEAGRILSITYRTKDDGTDSQRQGVLSPGQNVTLAPGMIFNCYNTSRA